MKTDKPMEGRFFMGPETFCISENALFKCIETAMELNPPPPYYMSCDVIDDMFVVSIVPEYDYEKIVNHMRDVGSPENLANDCYVVMPMILIKSDSVQLPDEGKTRFSIALVGGARVYFSVSSMKSMYDTDILEKISLN